MFMINDSGIHVELTSSAFQRAVSIKQILIEEKPNENNSIDNKAL